MLKFIIYFTDSDYVFPKLVTNNTNWFFFSTFLTLSFSFILTKNHKINNNSKISKIIKISQKGNTHTCIMLRVWSVDTIGLVCKFLLVTTLNVYIFIRTLPKQTKYLINRFEIALKLLSNRLCTIC